jgi:hypothetical protein
LGIKSISTHCHHGDYNGTGTTNKGFGFQGDFPLRRNFWIRRTRHMGYRLIGSWVWVGIDLVDGVSMVRECASIPRVNWKLGSDYKLTAEAHMPMGSLMRTCTIGMNIKQFSYTYSLCVL